MANLVSYFLGVSFLDNFTFDVSLGGGGGVPPWPPGGYTPDLVSWNNEWHPQYPIALECINTIHCPE